MKVFNTIAGFRSAISAYRDPIGGITVGSNPRVSALLSGIFNSRPPQAKYTFTRYLTKHNSGYIFHFGKNTKTSKKGKPRNPIKFIPFGTNKNLCVCHHIDLYLEKTKEWHKTEPQFLISVISPHRGVST